MANQPKRFFHTASEPEIKAGQVSDVYFQRTIQILKAKGLNKRVKAEVDPTPGAEVQKFVLDIIKAPKDIVDRANKAME